MPNLAVGLSLVSGAEQMHQGTQTSFLLPSKGAAASALEGIKVQPLGSFSFGGFFWRLLESKCCIKPGEAAWPLTAVVAQTHHLDLGYQLPPLGQLSANSGFS